MRLFLYYAFCSIKNQIKKLFKSWVIIFIVACMLIGGLVGLGVGFLEEELTDPPTEEVAPPEEEQDDLITVNAGDAKAVVEIGISVMFIAFIFFALINADKDGSAIFTMPDVNLLFSAPIKPQSVLLFKLMTQIFLMLFAGVYLTIEIPILAVDMGLSALSALMCVLAWLLILVIHRLVNIFAYTLTSSHVGYKRYLRPLAILVLALTLGAFGISYLRTDGIFEALKSTFVGGISRYIPLYGWLKCMVVFAIEKRYIPMTVSLLLLLLCIVLFTYCIWKLKADFYEEAMKKSGERAEFNGALTDGRVAKRDKDRSDKITRDGLNRGEGASVFLHKALYNRRRFSYFGFLTKTSVFYLSVGTLVSFLLRFVIGFNSFIPIGLGLCLVVFFRSLGNPLAQDMSSVYFITVPASAHEKVFFSLIGGTLSCALDVLPCVLLSALLLSASPLEVIAFYLLAVCVDFYASNVMLFIEFSLPSSLSLQVKQLVSILFIYFGILPMAIVVAVGALLGFFEAFLFIASAVAFAIGGVVYAFTPLFIANGKK